MKFPPAELEPQVQINMQDKLQIELDKLCIKFNLLEIRRVRITDRAAEHGWVFSLILGNGVKKEDESLPSHLMGKFGWGIDAHVSIVTFQPCNEDAIVKEFLSWIINNYKATKDCL